MPITVVTGIPGHGKTLLTLVRVKELAEREGRPVFFNGIKGLKLDWQELPARDWSEVPANGIMVIDEAQKVFPIRQRSSEVPPWVAGLETHRHLGVDIWLITQHPTLIDNHVRKLVDRHLHVVRAWGTHYATVFDFRTGIQDNPEKSKRKDGVGREQWRYPKAAFEWYESSEKHTVKTRIPAKLWFFLALVFVVIPLLLWYVYVRLQGHLHPGAAGAGSAAQSASSPALARPERAVATRLADAMSASEYLQLMRPRIPGLAFTAPAYDQLTKPVEAPYPSVCAYSPDFPCRCWSQRGFKLEVPKPLCEQLAREPMDPYWLRRGPLGFERGQGGESAASSAPGSGQAVSQADVQASAR